nr:hypothetical protein [Tanacetum cinerariifolium]
MSTLMFFDPESSNQADRTQSSRVPVPLPEDPYEAIRQAYLVRTDTESEPFEGEARTPESPHIVAPPTCHVEESEGSGTSGASSTSSDSTASLSPDHPLTHTTPILVSILLRTACMAVRVLPAMSPGLSTGIAKVAAMFDLAFRKRFRSSYDSLPLLTLPVRKRYRGTSKLILGTDNEKDEEVDESSDSDSESEDVEEKGPTAEHEDPAAEDEGLAVRVEGPNVDDESYGLDGESHGVDDKSHGLDDESYGIDGEGRGIKSGGLGLGTTCSDTTFTRVDVWFTSYFTITFYCTSPVSSPMIPLTVPSPIASPMATSTATIPVNEDWFIKVGAWLELYRGILQDHTQRLDAMPPTLFVEIDRDERELYTISGAVRDEIFSKRYQFGSLEHEQERTVVTFGALWRPVLALKAWAGRTALQQELHEMRDRVTALEQERDRRER